MGTCSTQFLPCVCSDGKHSLKRSRSSMRARIIGTPSASQADQDATRDSHSLVGRRLPVRREVLVWRRHQARRCALPRLRDRRLIRLPQLADIVLRQQGSMLPPTPGQHHHDTQSNEYLFSGPESGHPDHLYIEEMSSGANQLTQPPFGDKSKHTGERGRQPPVFSPQLLSSPAPRVWG